MSKEKESHDAVCLECGDRIIYGRSDRKFCCDACKNKFHNRQARNSRHFRQQVNTALEKNYFILDSLRKTSLRNIQMSDLRNMGFHPEFFTSYRKNASREAFMCYDLKYCVCGKSVTSISRISVMSDEDICPHDR